jgi:hypothetical protein
MSDTRFRVSFYGVTSYKGCLALVQQATACQAGQVGCPAVVVVDAGGAQVPASGNATNWDTQLTSSIATTLCSANTYPGLPASNSVEFDYLTQ